MYNGYNVLVILLNTCATLCLVSLYFVSVLFSSQRNMRLSERDTVHDESLTTTF